MTQPLFTAIDEFNIERVEHCSSVALIPMRSRMNFCECAPCTQRSWQSMKAALLKHFTYLLVTAQT